MFSAAEVTQSVKAPYAGTTLLVGLIKWQVCGNSDGEERNERGEVLKTRIKIRCERERVEGHITPW